MRSLPLLLSAHPSAWGDAAGHPKRQDRPLSPDCSCRFCCVFAAGRQEVFHLDGEHTNDAADNLVASCPSCHLVQHLDAAAHQRAAVLIWMPEMDQAIVVATARAAHTALLRAHESPSLDRPPSRTTPDVVAAWRALHVLREREETARSRLLTSDPLVLAAALLALTPNAYRDRAYLLQGIRLLPTGRMLRGGKDIYPGLLRAWAGMPQPEERSIAA